MITVRELIERGEADVQTGPFGTQLKASEYVESGIPVINVRNVGFGDIRDADLEFITEAKADQLKAHRLKSGDIVFGRKGAVERHALISEEQDGWVQGSDCLRLRLASSTVCERYTSYYLRTRAHQDWMQALCSFGATMASLNQDIVKRISIPLPELTIQRKIAAILTAYDDLIETNKRRIALLEKMAEELYREWFVRMRFPGHQNTKFVKGVPGNWPFELGSEFFDHVKGKSYSSDQISDEDGSRYFITLKSFHRRGGYRPEGLKFYTGPHKDAQVVNCGDVVMAVTDMTQDRAVVGEVARVPSLPGKKAVISLDVMRLVPKEMSTTFLYAYMRYSGFARHIKEFANGANVLHLKPDLVGQQRLLFPPDTLRQKYTKLADPIYDEAEDLANANLVLANTRDLLLPRLISGKLSVKDLDIQFPPSMQNESPQAENSHA
jgi:type I restriction enzyme S subunit